MSRVAILNCSNCTQDANCAATGCLSDIRNRTGFFKDYPKDEPLDLIGIINCAGCPTISAPEKILKKVASLAEYNIDALHFSYCMKHLCPFVNKYKSIISQKYPDIKIVFGTHEESPNGFLSFREGVKEILAPTQFIPQDMNNFIKNSLKTPQNKLQEELT